MCLALCNNVSKSLLETLELVDPLVCGDERCGRNAEDALEVVREGCGGAARRAARYGTRTGLRRHARKGPSYITNAFLSFHWDMTNAYHVCNPQIRS